MRTDSVVRSGWARARGMVLLGALLAFQGCGLDDVDIPELDGPSTLAANLVLRIDPDLLVADGRSTALVTATFRLKLGSKVVLETPPQSFMLESRAGVLDTVIEGVSHNPEQSAGVGKEVEALKGTPSEGVEKLRKALAASHPAA